MINPTTFVTTLYASRLRDIERFSSLPHEVQRRQFVDLIGVGSKAQYLNHRGVTAGMSYEDYAARVPVAEYQDLQPYIDRIKAGEKNVLWPKPTHWFAKSSGTTQSQSKYIPVTKDSLHSCQFKGGRDSIIMFSDKFPESKALTGKTLTLGGSVKLSDNELIPAGDLSGIMISNAPFWTRFARFPKSDVALISDFDQKVSRICELSLNNRDITCFAGVPSWNLVLMNRIMEHAGVSDMHSVWPDMSLFIHGGIGFGPYRKEYQKIFPDPSMHYLETYNASEGFFAIQDGQSDGTMLLMLDYGIFYEFLDTKHLGDHSKIVPLEGVELGKKYAIIITTNGGLWRYMIGDTVEFVSKNPYRIKITGRTRQYINVFGEELIVDNAEKALSDACAATGAVIRDYTVAPIFMQGSQKGAHEWFVEFENMPNCSVDQFADILDKNIQMQNSDYQAKRSNNSTLSRLKITSLPSNSFLRWMESRGKLGGQNKVPRLSNDRTIVDGLSAFLGLAR